jgi:hypothetical protein
MELAETGVRRPTTGRPTACVWGGDSAEPLLDWLEIPQRNRTVRESVLDADRETRLHGLVLLDLPDHDSTQLAHRLEVNRLVELVDLLVWVVDPQKYADEALHTGYLKRLRNHDGVMIVVLNQIDRLSPAEAQTCRTDLRRLLDADGLESVRMLATSATTGQGVDELRHMLADVVDVQGAVAERAVADIQASARRLMDGVAASEPEAKDLRGADELVGALAQAAGLPVVLDAVTADYRRQAARATGWPFARWWAQLRPDPLRRLKLGTAEGELRALARTSIPEATPSQKARVELAVRSIVSSVTEVLPRRWADSVRAVAMRPDADLSDALDAAIGGVDLTLRPPNWWRSVNLAQVVLAVAAVLGLAWLVVLGVIKGSHLASVQTPAFGPVSLPLALLLGGLILGGVAALAVRRAIAVGARRRRARVASAMREAVQDVAWGYVIAPVAEVLTDHRKVREALARAA